MVPRVVSGIKNLRLIKTDQATFVGFHRDAYRTLPELHERILRLSMGSWRRWHLINVHLLHFSTNVRCSWTYRDDAVNIDYDDVWERSKNCIVESWGGDVVDGVLSSCMQYTLQTAEKSIFKSIPEINSIEMLMPNLLYADFNFASFKSLLTESGERRIYLPVEKPSGLAFAKMVRKNK